MPCSEESTSRPRPIRPNNFPEDPIFKTVTFNSVRNKLISIFIRYKGRYHFCERQQWEKQICDSRKKILEQEEKRNERDINLLLSRF